MRPFIPELLTQLKASTPKPVVSGVSVRKAMDNAQNDHVAVVQSMLANKEQHL